MPTRKPIPKKLHTLISEHPLFSALPTTSRDQLIAGASLTIFEGGEALINENEPNATLFLLLKGEATVIMNDTPAGKLIAGDVAGEISAIGMSPPIASVIADNEVETIAFPSESIIRATQSHSEFANQLRKAAFKRVSG